MFAILETGSKQYIVEEGDVLEVELLEEEKISNANTVNFDSVLLVKDDGVHIGQPFVKDAFIQAKILEEFKGPKVIIFKKKAKKQYKRTRGHRQKLHRIQIEKIQIKPGEDAEDVSEQAKSPAKEAQIENPAPKVDKVKTTTKTKKDTPEPKEKKQTDTMATKEKAPDQQKEKE
jgi:large subunit ribosomal protein L21